MEGGKEGAPERGYAMRELRREALRLLFTFTDGLANTDDSSEALDILGYLFSKR